MCKAPSALPEMARLDMYSHLIATVERTADTLAVAAQHERRRKATLSSYYPSSRHPNRGGDTASLKKSPADNSTPTTTSASGSETEDDEPTAVCYNHNQSHHHQAPPTVISSYHPGTPPGTTYESSCFHHSNQSHNVMATTPPPPPSTTRKHSPTQHTSRRRGCKPSPSNPGFTAKNHPRRFVQHDYHDHAHDKPEQQPQNQSDDGDHVSSPLVLPLPRGGISTPFPIVLHTMLDSVEKLGVQEIVSWQPHGRAFCVHDPVAFVQDVMPRFFRQSKISSFQRQLNLYGFCRLTGTGPDKGAYYHEFFLRGRADLCSHMHRTRVKGTGVRTSSNPEAEPNFYEMSPVGPVGTTPSPWKTLHQEEPATSHNKAPENCVFAQQGPAISQPASWEEHKVMASTKLERPVASRQEDPVSSLATATVQSKMEQNSNMCGERRTAQDELASDDFRLPPPKMSYQHPAHFAETQPQQPCAVSPHVPMHISCEISAAPCPSQEQQHYVTSTPPVPSHISISQQSTPFPIYSVSDMNDVDDAQELKQFLRDVDLDSLEDESWTPRMEAA